MSQTTKTAFVFKSVSEIKKVLSLYNNMNNDQNFIKKC